MKKLLAIATALTVSVAFCAAIAMAGNNEVDTSVSINFAAGNGGSYAPYAEDVFSGKVKAKKGCKKNRTIVLKGPVGGSTQSAKNGSWEISLGNAPAGSYKATAEIKVIQKKHGVIVCNKGKSDSITVP
jgi:hypothetical protein